PTIGFLLQPLISDPQGQGITHPYFHATGSQYQNTVNATPQGLPPSTCPQDLAPLRQIEIARHAAATLPTPYHVNEKAEAARRTSVARAIDCWYLTTGEKYEKEPPEEVKAHLGTPGCSGQ
ncbi:hypothetical protein FRC11_012134, partial [Ceratobasidium sp. 423]